VKVRFGVYLLRLVRFYHAYSTLIVDNCYVTGGVLISFQISRSTGVSIATAFNIRAGYYKNDDFICPTDVNRSAQHDGPFDTRVGCFKNDNLFKASNHSDHQTFF